MDGFDLPLRPESDTREERERPAFLRAENLRRLATDPILWLVVIASTVFLLDFILHLACGGEEDFCGPAGRTSLSAVILLSLLLGGFALREAFSRYLLASTQFLAALVAALPIAHFLATDYAGAPAEPSLPPPPDLAPLELALAEAEARTLLLEDRIDALEAERARLATPGTPLPSIQDVREIAAEEAAKVAAAEEAAMAERLAAAEEEVIETIVDRQRRSEALSEIGPRLAAAGPVLRAEAEEAAEPPLPAELAEIAERLGMSAAERSSLARDTEAQTCISTRLAERGPFAALNQRMNPERLAEYLAVCFTS